MGYANGFYGVRDAYKATHFPISKFVFASVWKAQPIAQWMRFATITDGSATLDYRRRAFGDEVKLRWILPGQAISPSKDPAVVEARSTLRLATNDVQVASHLRSNYNNAQFNAPTGGMFKPGADPLWGKVLHDLGDFARQAWDTWCSGKYIDLCVLAPGGGLTAAFTGVITPGPYNDPGRGNGSLKYVAATNKASFRAPGDADYGPEVVVAAATPVTLRSGNTDARITFTVGALPGSDGHCDLIFSSTSQVPDGLINLMEPAQIVRFPTPTTPDFRHLDELHVRLAPAYRNAPFATPYVMNDKTFIELSSLARGLGGATLETKSFGTMVTQVPAGMEPFGLVEVPVYRGHPIIIDNSLPMTVIDGKETYPILLVCLDPKVSEGNGTEFGAFVGAVRGRMDGPVFNAYGFGWEIVYLGRDQNSTNDKARISLEMCWALGSSGAAAMTEGFWTP